MTYLIPHTACLGAINYVRGNSTAPLPIGTLMLVDPTVIASEAPSRFDWGNVLISGGVNNGTMEFSTPGLVQIQVRVAGFRLGLRFWSSG